MKLVYNKSNRSFSVLPKSILDTLNKSKHHLSNIIEGDGSAVQFSCNGNTYVAVAPNTNMYDIIVLKLSPDLDIYYGKSSLNNTLVTTAKNFDKDFNLIK